MATNTPAKVPNIKRYDIDAGINETQIDFEGAVGVIAFHIQCVDSIDIRCSFDAAGTWSTDNFWTLKADDVWIERDINWVHGENLWVRSEGAATVVEVLYWA